MNIRDVINEMSFEIGTKADGTYGYRSIVGNNMTEKTPPKNKQFIDAVMKVLESKNYLERLKKFDLTKIDVESLTNGGAKINFEDGNSTVLKPEEISNYIKDLKEEKMNFKEATKMYLSEAIRKVEDYNLAKGVKMNDVILGWSKIKNPTQWEKIKEDEFINFIKIYMQDTSSRKKTRGKEDFMKNFTQEDFKDAYLKFRAIVMDERKLKKGQTVSFSDMRSDLDRNPGNTSNMIVNIFFDLAAEEAKKGYTSRSHMEAVRDNADTKQPLKRMLRNNNT